MACVWTLHAQGDDIIELTFPRFATEGCCDCLSIYDGENARAGAGWYGAGRSGVMGTVLWCFLCFFEFCWIFGAEKILVWEGLGGVVHTGEVRGGQEAWCVGGFAVGD